MKILITHPKIGSAIHRLTVDLVSASPHIDFRVVDVHPKRADKEQIERFKEAYDWADLWDSQYWKTSEMLLDNFGNPRNIPIILTHHNPYDLQKSDWGRYKKVIVMNKTQSLELPAAYLIPHSVNLSKFPFQKFCESKKYVIMVAARIESKKGILPVALACQQLGVKLVLVGQISDINYFNEIMRTGSVVYYENISDEKLVKLYSESFAHICNSVDNFESGTMPILEAMACGTPVISRSVGLVPDIYDGTNLLLRDGDVENTEEIRASILLLMNNAKKRKEMREAAYKSVRNYDHRRRALHYSNMYNSTIYSEPLVSIVMPVFGRSSEFQKNIDAINKQTYKNIEIVVVSDGDESFDNLKIKTNRTIKYYRVGDYHSYGLGLARDYGVLEAEGKILVFLDQRFIPDEKLVEEFVKNISRRKWLYGNKGTKRNFVENVSCIYREDFINMGMSNQLINMYGGMSQELRERSRIQGIEHKYIDTAKAHSVYSSHNTNERKSEIVEMKLRLWKLGLY